MNFWGGLYRLTEVHGDTAIECREVLRGLGVAALNGARLLDVGCGDGRHVNHLRSIGVDVRGVDFDADALTSTCDLGDMRALPYPDASFNCLYSLRNSALGFPREELALVWTEMVRVLRPEGLCFVTYSSPEWARAGVATMGAVTEEVRIVDGGMILRRQVGDAEGSLFVRLPTRDEWPELLAGYGLELISVDDSGPLATLVARRLGSSKSDVI